MEKTIARFQASTDEDLRWQLQFNGLDLSGRALAVHVRERGSNVLKVKLTIGSGLTLIGTGNLNARVARSAMLGWARTEYETDVVDETGGDATTIVAVRVVYDEPGRLPYGVRGNQATVQWGGNQAVVTAIGGVGPGGPAGPANELTIGDVFTLETGAPATATLTGEAPAQVLNLGLPKGGTGVQGPAGTIAVGTVTKVAASDPAKVTNTGTASAAIFDFDIPAGSAATVAIGSVTASLPGDAPTVTNVGTATAAVFDFTLPRGDQGPPGSVADGDKGDVVVSGGGTVWTVQADAPAIAAMMPKTGGVFTGPITVSTGIAGEGYGTLVPGTATTPGYLAYHDETGARVGYLGYGVTVGGQNYLEAAAEGSMAGWYFPQRPVFNGATPLDTANFVGALLNCGLAAAVGSNALTISLTDAAGSAPSAASPVVIPFRSATAANGNLASRVLTGSTTLVISSGSTTGFANATAGRLWIVAFDDGGSVCLGAINCRSGVNIFPLGQFGIASSTAEGGAGAADSAHVFYTGTAVTSKAYTVLGYMEWAAGLTTAGTWAIVPTRIDTFKPGMKLPGDVVQSRIETNNTYATNGANVIPADDSEPQNTEGNAISTLAFTPSSSANVLDVSTSGQIGSIVANTGVALTICRSDQSNCIASGASYIETAGGYVLASLQQYVVSGATSSVDFTNRYGPFAAGSGRSINGGASVRQFGASQAFVLKVKEIVA